MIRQQIEDTFQSFNDLKILVVGDLMIEAYIIGKVERISPEAPVPIVSISKRDNRLGGAANVALNLRALGVTTYIAGLVGNDKNADVFIDLLQNNGINGNAVIKDTTRPTTIKTRIISGHQQMMRVDEEETNEISGKAKDGLLSAIKHQLDDGLDAIILEDYNKGVLSADVIKEIIGLAKTYDVITTVDPKEDNFFAYEGVTLFKPNLKELKMGLKVDLKTIDLLNLDKASITLSQKLGNQYTFITLSEHGVYISDGLQSHHIPAHIRDISDVSGAGDTVISVATCCLAKNIDQEHIAAIANLAGGLVCESSGVVPISKQLLLEETIKHLCA